MLWIDGWGEALRNPMMKKISQQLDEQSTELVARIIRNGVESGEFACPDPGASAMRLTALVDGLAVQFAAHDGMMNRDQLIEHVRFVAAAEIGVDVSDFGTSPLAHVTAAPSPATDAALRRLVGRYCDAVNRLDRDAWASTWTDDAIWEIPGDSILGRTKIIAAFERLIDDVEWAVQTSPLMIFEVDEANGTGTGRVTIQDRVKRRKAAKPTSMLAVSHDRYVRHNGAWLCAERRLEVIERT
jgi:ketosteroid isomerase-like protein